MKGSKMMKQNKEKAKIKMQKKTGELNLKKTGESNLKRNKCENMKRYHENQIKKSSTESKSARLIMPTTYNM